jgi:aminopeptidase N
MGSGKFRIACIFLAGLLSCPGVSGQGLFVNRPSPVFTHADTLRGMITPERSCYDVRYYHLDVKIDPAKQFIEGSNTIRFTVDSSFDRMQVDLFNNMSVGAITLDGGSDLPFDRDSNALFLRLPHRLAKGSDHDVKISFSGSPQIAKNPPWLGGFTWKQDSSGNPWVVVTSQGTGASLWWPNKDHQADKPDSVLISVTVPDGLMDVSNGRLRAQTTLAGGWTRYDWFVSYPINNYNVTINVGKFAHFSDVYQSGGDALTLDYYVLPVHLEAAKAQFAQAKLMLASYEKFFGKYPFYRDGYKLIEAPHNGMEHQSAIAYGNRFLGGYVGRASSEVGLKFDFIIVHESAHEWWGNSVTAKDIADMWLHESFGAYAEALFVEDHFGRDESLAYINGKKQNVRNVEPIIGTYNVQKEGSGDMYDKGQLVLNTFRSVIDNDSLWFSILRGIQSTYAYSTITSDTIVAFVNRKTGKDYAYFFDQYLRHPGLPRLEVFTRKKGDRVIARYRWAADVPEFRMPVMIESRSAKKGLEWIYPTTKMQTMELDGSPEDFHIADQLFYVDFKLNVGYVDPRMEE